MFECVVRHDPIPSIFQLQSGRNCSLSSKIWKKWALSSPALRFPVDGHTHRGVRTTRGNGAQKAHFPHMYETARADVRKLPKLQSFQWPRRFGVLYETIVGEGDVYVPPMVTYVRPNSIGVRCAECAPWQAERGQAERGDQITKLKNVGVYRPSDCSDCQRNSD